MIEAFVIANAIDTTAVALPLRLADGVEVTEADADQAEIIRTALRRYETLLSRNAATKHDLATVLDRRVEEHPADQPFRWSEHFSFNLAAPDGSTGGWVEYGRDGEPHRVVQHDLRPDRTYPLIRLVDDNDHTTIMTVITAMSLMEPPILLPFGVLWDGRTAEDAATHGHGWMTAQFHEPNDELREVWSTRTMARPVVIDDAWLRSAEQLIAAVRPIVGSQWPGIQAAFQRRLELSNVPIDSPLRHLGYFIVIEALLTHAPQSGDSADTLSRQLQTKLPLLSNRMTLPLPFRSLDPQASTGTIIKALYGYRSSIAHGGEPTFEASQRILGSREKVGAFLDTAARRLLRQAALEPQLVSDLRG